MSAPIGTRQWVPATEFLEAHRDPKTGRRLMSREAFYLGVKQGRLPHIHSGRRILVPTDLFDQIASRPAVDADDAA